MTRDQWVREKAEKSLGCASLTPELGKGWTMKEYRRFIEGKRVAFWGLLKNPALPSTEFPLPWDKRGINEVLGMQEKNRNGKKSKLHRWGE